MSFIPLAVRSIVTAMTGQYVILWLITLSQLDVLPMYNLQASLIRNDLLQDPCIMLVDASEDGDFGGRRRSLLERVARRAIVVSQAPLGRYREI